ncbi:MAG: hypothetical protein H6Q90_582 [Deltaproteobacteria bacterium]|nr:hypothetical protein [Deltaproteobacteria bacterium]
MTLLGYFRRKAVAWELVTGQLEELVIHEPGRDVHGTLHGIRLHLRFDEATGFTTIATALPDDRFSLRITPRPEATPRATTKAITEPTAHTFDTRFTVHATPLDLPRFVLDADVCAKLVAIEPPPTILLEPPLLTFEVEGFLDAPSLLAALELIAKLARSLADRAAMCARP